MSLNAGTKLRFFSPVELEEIFLHAEERTVDKYGIISLYHGSKLFSISGINPTIINRIGKKRLELLNIMLDGFQYRL